MTNFNLTVLLNEHTDFHQIWSECAQDRATMRLRLGAIPLTMARTVLHRPRIFADFQTALFSIFSALELQPTEYPRIFYRF